VRTRLRPARLHLARFRACRVLSVIVLGCVLGSFPGSPLLAVDQPPVPGTEVIRGQIQVEIQRRQEAQKQLSLKQAASQVAEGRVNELKKQVDDATKRLETEKADVARIQQETAALDAQLVSLNDLLKKHEEADRLQKDAAAANTRLEAIVAARGKLESEMSALRKASVEHQSKAVESEQKVQSLEATRADLTKAATEAKTAFDAAQQQSAAADTALATATAALTTLTTGLTAEQQRLDAATAASGKITESVAALQKSLEGLKESAKSTGVNSDEAVNALTAAINELVPLQKNSATLIQQVTARRDALNPQVETAKAEAEKKEG
jgi:chromosome segregation ATPase